MSAADAPPADEEAAADNAAASSSAVPSHPAPSHRVPSGSAPSHPGDARAVLGGSGFRRLLAARLTSQIADGWYQAGLAGSLLFNPEKGTGGVAVAMGFAILLLPYSILGPFVGVFLDRWRRRGSLLTANLIRAGLVLPTVALLWTDTSGPAFAGCALLVIAANRFFLAGLGASLPHVVADDRLVTGNAIATTLGTVGYATGLGTAVALLGTPLIKINNHGYAGIALLGGIGYLVSALLLRALFRPADLGPDDAFRRTDAVSSALRDVATGMVAGVRHLVAHRPAGHAVLVQAGARALFGVLSLATLLLSTHYFTVDSARSVSGLGLVVIAGGLGALCAAVITPIVTRRLPGWAWIGVMLAGSGVVLLILAPRFQIGPLLIVVFLVNIASQGTKIMVDATLQHECDDAFRGRVFSINDTAFNLTFVAGLFVAATLLPPTGRSSAAVVLVALGYVALSLIYTMRTRAYTRISES